MYSFLMHSYLNGIINYALMSPPIAVDDNKTKLADAELPFDANGRLYHLGLKKGEVYSYVISVGDERRARLIALQFDGAKDMCNSPRSVSSTGSFGSIDDIEGVFGYRSNRGFVTFSGTYKGLGVSVIAIGMGYPNMDFMVREVRVIVDGPLVILRVGTCGSIAKTGAIGMLAVPNEGSVMVQRNYDYPFNVSQTSLLIVDNEEPYRISKQYLPDKNLTECLQKTIKASDVPLLLGRNASSDSFYASQGRKTQYFNDTNELLIEQLISRSVSTVEMETAQLFHLASMVRDLSLNGIHASAVHIVVADRARQVFLTDPEEREKLDALAGHVALETLLAFNVNICK